MFEELLNLVKQHAGNAIIDNPAIPNEHNDAVVAAAGSSIMDGLKKMIAGGNAQDVVNLFNHQGGSVANTPAVQQMSGDFIQNLMSKFGLGQGAASGIAANIIPAVVEKLVHKTNDPNDTTFNIQNIISSLGSGGGFDVQDVLRKFTDGNTTASGGGGILDTLKGLMGK